MLRPSGIKICFIYSYSITHIHDITAAIFGAILLLNRICYKLTTNRICKKAITTLSGLLKLLRMHSGLRNATETFQPFIDNVYPDFAFVQLYIYDLFVTFSNVDEKHQHLTSQFKPLSVNRIIVNPTK